MGGWADGWFMKLMKRKKKRTITLSFTSPETDFFFISMKSLHGKINKKSADIYYLYVYIYLFTHTHTHTHIYIYIYIYTYIYMGMTMAPGKSWSIYTY